MRFPDTIRRATVLAAAALGLLGAGTAQAAWQKAESPHFVVYYGGGEAILRDYIERLEAFDAVLRQRHGPAGTGLSRPLPIYLVTSRDDLQRVSPKLTDEVAGVYFASEGDIFAVAQRERGADRIVKHEYVHHFMLQHFPASYPAWLTEGYAEFWMTTDLEADAIHIGRYDRDRVSWLINIRTWIPYDKVLRHRPDAFVNSQARIMYYAQAWLLTHWFMGDASTANPVRYPKLVAYMKAVAAGADPVDAMRDVTGLTPEALEKTLRAYLRGAMPYESWPRARLARPPVKVTTLPASADDLLLEAQRIKQHGADAELVARVRARAAKHRGDRLAELTLAHAEIRGGDRAAGEAALRRWLATHPDDVEALAMLAETLIEGAEDETDAAKQKAMLDEAGRHLGRASRLEPDRYQTLYVYARSRMGEPGEPTLNTLEALDRAQELAPQVTSIRLNYAAALLHDGRTGPAEIILAPLLNDPHDARAAAVARAMLAQAKGEAAPAAEREP